MNYCILYGSYGSRLKETHIFEKSNKCTIYKKYVRKIEKFKYSKKIKNMIEEILDTKLKLKIARLFSSSNAELQVSDVARILKISKSRASECLKELAEKKLLECRRIGRSLVYKKASNQFAQEIFKSLSLEEKIEEKLERNLIEKLKKFKPISVVIFGSYLQKFKPDSDIDVLVLVRDDSKKEELYKISSELSERYGFVISILLMKEEEFKEKVKKGDPFAINLLANHKKVFGKDLEEVAWR